MRPLRIGFAGTGTEVGKTTVARRAAAGLRDSGRRVLALKPVETGFQDPAKSDAAALAEAAGHPLVLPYFAAEAPVAPMRAAHDLGDEIDLAAAARWVREQEHHHRPDVILVETAGGLFTPLARSYTNLDLLLALDLDGWLLVARDRLGSLHDTLATLAAARARQCSPIAVILGAQDANPPPNNLEDLRICTELPAHRAPDERELAALLLARRPS